jgi:putative ABC transport system substrate-binding protein
LLFALCSSVSAQQPAKIRRIGYLSALDRAGESSRAETIRLALRTLGYIEGQNIAIDYRYTHGNAERASELAAQLVQLKVDVIVVAGGDPWIQAAKNTTKRIPIVMVGPGRDPVEAGLVESLARPGGNVTGITNLARELTGKQLELLKEAVPNFSRVAVLYDPAIPTNIRDVDDIRPVARSLGLRASFWEVRVADDFDRVFAALNKERPDGLYVSGGPLMTANQKRLVGLALKNRLPSVYIRSQFVEAGGLMSYGVDIADSYRRVAIYVDKLLNGAKPGDLPVERPTKFELVINLKTAKQIGLNISPGVLSRADRVIK